MAELTNEEKTIIWLAKDRIKAKKKYRNLKEAVYKSLINSIEDLTDGNPNGDMIIEKEDYKMLLSIIGEIDGK